MKSAYYTEIGTARDVLINGELETPKPSANEVLISVKASGINPSDVKRRAGWQNKNLPFPLIIPHSDGAGQIVQVGSNLSTDLIGNSVWIWNAQGGYAGPGRAFGTAAEFIAVSVTQVSKLPDNVTFEEGACLGVPLRTSHRAVFADGPIDNKLILVQGAGGVVGNFAVQLASQFGATVIATAGSKERMSHALDAGAHHVVNRHDLNFKKEIMDITKGLGVDRIIEIEFGGNIETDIDILKPNGIIAAYSSTTVPNPTFPYYKLAAKGGQINLIQSFNLPLEAEQQCQRDLQELCEAGKFKVSIGKVLPISEISSAHEMVEAKTIIGNVVLKI